jgi:hypothetical protein
VAALGAIDDHLSEHAWLEWVETIAALRPRRGKTDADEPFTL